MQLQTIATVTHGAFLSRIETSPEDTAAQIVKLYTTKELNKSLGLDYRGDHDRVTTIHVASERFAKLKLASEKMVVVNLLSQKAAAIRKEHTGLLIPSNFVVIEWNEPMSPLYFEWYFNEHPSCRKQLLIARQGTSISTLSIQMLRELDILMPPPNKQELVGKMYRALKKKQALQMERNLLEEQFMNCRIIKAIGDMNHDNK
ncbi:restriction endonuclease subunit S domain-containing protein [Domibacillus indicus]|uniref:hypothetical protein n=1 Tax=Domibacillus indicus TaxID=1437523 RepID=UPI000617F819|nr:hypothetical protein [Domibacillus indicus]